MNVAFTDPTHMFLEKVDLMKSVCLLAVVRSKAVVLLVLIHCLFLLQLFVGYL